MRQKGGWKRNISKTENGEKQIELLARLEK